MKGSGFQAAAGPAVFEVLRTRLGVAFECFASPLNARYSRYCSAFPDTDAPFGSAGSFFGFSPTKGAYELNPPFVPALLDRAASRALALTAAAEAAGSALTFAIALPGWGELEGRAGLLLSPLKRLSMRIAAADHGFVDGAAHARRDPFRASPYDTDVVVLQTAAAARKNPLDACALEQELRAAFAACVPSEAAARRQGRLPNRQ
jgi:phosphorylated CTD-interacting factor 1